jgi:ADP-heptose:LPS heptosyltransferase
MILPEYSSRLSARIPERATLRSAEIALTALQEARPGTLALVRPHPADPDLHSYRALGARFDRLRVEVDGTSPIECVIAGADLCIGTVSTATLQAAAAGVPIVFLDVATAPAPWPFDHSGALPRATDAEGLAAAIPPVLAGEGQPTAGTIAEALGMVPDAEERVLALLRETF